MDARNLTDKLYWVRDRRLAADFPPPERALDEPDGLLAIGGDLTVPRLLRAYSLGIFPWYSDGQPLMWWSPDPRCVLSPDGLHVSRSLAKTLRNAGFSLSTDRCFAAVIDACAAPRATQAGTWITTEMRAAYLTLHQLGHAHSVECWCDGELVGGLYGVGIGRAFFGESMFSRARDASKVALAGLCRRLDAWGYRLIDCQMHTPHLAQLGAQLLPRARFQALLADCVTTPPAARAWHDEGLPA